MKRSGTLSPSMIPMIRLPVVMTPFTSKLASVPNAGAPTIPHTPLIAKASMAWRSTAGRPLDSSVKSAPPPVILCTASTGSVSRLFTVWVAPSSFASARRDGTTSAAMMVVAPATRAAITALKPTAPPPNAAKLLPGLTLKAFMTAPAPV